MPSSRKKSLAIAPIADARAGHSAGSSCSRSIALQGVADSVCWPDRRGRAGRKRPACVFPDVGSTGRILPSFSSLYSPAVEIGDRWSCRDARQRECGPCPSQSSCGRRGQSPAGDARVHGSNRQVDPQTCRNTGEESHKALSVRFSGSEVAQHGRRSLILLRFMSLRSTPLEGIA